MTHRQIGADKTPKAFRLFWRGSPFLKKGNTKKCMEILSTCLSVCPVQFVFTELQSGSHLLLGVPSKPKSCENSVDPQRIGSGKCEGF
jgi:hypothetical protein